MVNDKRKFDPEIFKLYKKPNEIIISALRTELLKRFDKLWPDQQELFRKTHQRIFDMSIDELKLALELCARTLAKNGKTKPSVPNID